MQNLELCDRSQLLVPPRDIFLATSVPGEIPSPNELTNLGDIASRVGLGWMDVIKPLAAHAGARFAPDASHLLSRKKGFSPDNHFAHATFQQSGERITIRDDSASPLAVIPNDEGSFALTAPGITLAEFSQTAEPESNCLTNVAYFSDGKIKKSDTSITINPIQQCAQRCGFCRREYEAREGLARSSMPIDTLRYLSPAVMADTIDKNFSGIDWNSGMQISFVTGIFTSLPSMVNYIDAFSNAMDKTTQGKFNPRINANQNIHVASHLASTKDDYHALQSVGVKTYQNTIEIVNDTTRKEVMPKANSKARFLGKDDLRMADVLDQVSAGTNVLGVDNYFGALVLGLDTFDDTQAGLARLYGSGLRYIDAQPYQPFSVEGQNLFQQSAEELIRSHLASRAIFKQVKYQFGQN